MPALGETCTELGSHQSSPMVTCVAGIAGTWDACPFASADVGADGEVSKDGEGCRTEAGVCEVGEGLIPEIARLSSGTAASDTTSRIMRMESAR
jgi:hypothetical protein